MMGGAREGLGVVRQLRGPLPCTLNSQHLQACFSLYIILLHRYVCWGQDNTAVKTEVSGSDTISGDKREPAGSPNSASGQSDKSEFFYAVRAPV